MTPSRRLQGRQAYGRTVDAFDAVAWRPPAASRFDPRVANDVTPEPTVEEVLRSLPGWVTVVAGGAVAALMGAMLGGMLAL